MFENIATFALYALCIPKMKNLKTAKQGRLVFVSLRGEMLWAQCVKD